MKKKIAIVALLVLCLAAPVFAGNTIGASKRNTLGVGLNLGTNTGVGFRYGIGNFDVIANFGLDLLHIGSNGLAFGGDAGVAYQVYNFDLGHGNYMPLTVGLVGVTSFAASDNGVDFDLSVLVPVGIEYTFQDVPITLYLRLAPGMRIMQNTAIDLGFDFGAYIGALWNFDL